MVDTYQKGGVGSHFWRFNNIKWIELSECEKVFFGQLGIKLMASNSDRVSKMLSVWILQNRAIQMDVGGEKWARRVPGLKMWMWQLGLPSFPLAWHIL